MIAAAPARPKRLCACCSPHSESLSWCWFSVVAADQWPRLGPEAASPWQSHAQMNCAVSIVSWLCQMWQLVLGDLRHGETC